MTQEEEVSVDSGLPLCPFKDYFLQSDIDSSDWVFLTSGCK